MNCPYCGEKVLDGAERASHILAHHPEHSVEGMAVVEVRYPGRWFGDGKPRRAYIRVVDRPNQAESRR